MDGFANCIFTFHGTAYWTRDSRHVAWEQLNRCQWAQIAKCYKKSFHLTFYCVSFGTWQLTPCILLSSNEWVVKKYKKNEGFHEMSKGIYSNENCSEKKNYQLKDENIQRAGWETGLELDRSTAKGDSYITSRILGYQMCSVCSSSVVPFVTVISYKKKKKKPWVFIPRPLCHYLIQTKPILKLRLTNKPWFTQKKSSAMLQIK